MSHNTDSADAVYLISDLLHLDPKIRAELAKRSHYTSLDGEPVIPAADLDAAVEGITNSRDFASKGGKS